MSGFKKGDVVRVKSTRAVGIVVSALPMRSRGDQRIPSTLRPFAPDPGPDPYELVRLVVAAWDQDRASNALRTGGALVDAVAKCREAVSQWDR
jgi:hypothetical protein